MLYGYVLHTYTIFLQHSKLEKGDRRHIHSMDKWTRAVRTSGRWVLAWEAEDPKPPPLTCFSLVLL